MVPVSGVLAYAWTFGSVGSSGAAAGGGVATAAPGSGRLVHVARWEFTQLRNASAAAATSL